MSENTSHPDLLELTAQIVAAQVSKGNVDAASLPALIRQVYEALANAGAPQEEPQPERPQPAVPIKRSVFPDYIVCLEDGKKLKMLKRHLQSAYNMSPEQYRERWGLPSDYPLVAPNYAQRRSALAREIGLGRKISATGESKKETGRTRQSKKQD
ncbi:MULTISPECIES: MucR family transcriptional regulator [Gluconobacter]|jgi:predicted transcriptional regulator|uniref:MucR family transcriptional regulator n=1 Tax=Gluconobacter cerinus TaxID=38307 RepID=A0AAV5N9H9_9PROT|nr:MULTISPECIES: MucR family transcriptional regulator [Gluconobacter]MBS1018752.1 MucR family transcriptional regulator [Gluconobacter cerinus]MBS1024997.1 MucR family transcriptional regulator [Gluconobacter cerinus]MBS1035216.1 MucR family transcriptional regulator [Gluconobacter cerinus]MBS1037033.1 MucR family transcriptional regulator [Gluconobacter cerinus]MBS1043766.1 MucR family transcriptional regulator [Gluconobacter cerinus]